jgi:hypothetical protein
MYLQKGIIIKNVQKNKNYLLLSSCRLLTKRAGSRAGSVSKVRIRRSGSGTLAQTEPDPFKDPLRPAGCTLPQIIYPSGQLTEEGSRIIGEGGGLSLPLSGLSHPSRLLALTGSEKKKERLV